MSEEEGGGRVERRPGTTVYEMMRKKQKFSPQSLRERNRKRRWEEEATELKTTTYKVLSRYSVHRINPQCVLTNVTQRSPHWMVPATEAYFGPTNPPSDPRPQALKPLHRQDTHSRGQKM
uniref:Uncharacterized protein n=1 Tax=Nothobranchius furzeri TaxID=105023 RepID=A0A1A8B5D9_NOTFU